MRPQQSIPPDLRTAAYMGHNLGEAFYQSFAVRTQRGYYDAEPPELRRRTLARVKRLAAERPDSYLARHWQTMYRRLSYTFCCPTTGLAFTARPLREDQTKSHVLVWVACPHCDRMRRTQEDPAFDDEQPQPHCYAVRREETH